MSFTTLPYLLNTCFNQMKDKLTLHSIVDDIHYYNIKPECNLPILQLKTRSISFYFYKNRLITVYYKLDKSTEDNKQVIAVFEQQLNQKAFTWIVDEGIVFGWFDGNEFLGILLGNQTNDLTIYHTLNHYNVFRNKED